MLGYLRSAGVAVRLVDNWHRILGKAWSVILSLLMGAVSGLYCAWPAFQDAVPLRWYATGAVVMSVAIVIARLVKQPGIE